MDIQSAPAPAVSAPVMQRFEIHAGNDGRAQAASDSAMLNRKA